MESIAKYDAMIAEAESLGKRRVSLLWDFSTQNESITHEMLVEAVENEYRPRNGDPDILEHTFICAQIIRDEKDQISDITITLRITADINRYVYTDSPLSDYIDREGL